MPSLARIGLELVVIEWGAPINLDLRVESVSEDVLVAGTVTAPTVSECVRCLTAVHGHVQVTLNQLFAYPYSATKVTTEEDAVGHVVDGTIDLEQSIIDAVGIELPSRRCAGRIALDYAQNVVLHWSSSPVIPMTASTRGGPS